MRHRWMPERTTSCICMHFQETVLLVCLTACCKNQYSPRPRAIFCRPFTSLNHLSPQRLLCHLHSEAIVPLLWVWLVALIQLIGLWNPPGSVVWQFKWAKWPQVFNPTDEAWLTSPGYVNQLINPQIHPFWRSLWTLPSHLPAMRVPRPGLWNCRWWLLISHLILWGFVLFSTCILASLPLLSLPFTPFYKIIMQFPFRCLQTLYHLLNRVPHLAVVWF